MKMNMLLKKLYLDKKKFVTSEELKKHSINLKINYENTLRNLISRGHLIRIFKGIFYVPTLDEREFGNTLYSYQELIAKGLELKNINHWYFGLYTALKLNNMTHEEFTIDHVINDILFRANPIKIAGHKIKFYKLSPNLTTFGLKKNKFYSYSDPEKTILDFIYIWKYNTIPEERIHMDLSDYSKNLSKTKINRYAKYYPKTVQKTVEELL